MPWSEHLPDLDLSCLSTQTFSVVSVTVAAVVCAFTIFGNILILISIYKYPNQFKGSLYIFIGNLAAADLLLGVWLPLLIVEEVFGELKQSWSFCIAKPIGILVSYCCSIFSLSAISFDRFMAVMFPLKHLIKTQKRKFFILSIFVMWFVSIIGACLSIILPNLEPPVNSFLCIIGLVIPHSFALVTAIMLLLALLINCVLYGIVLWKIKHNKTPGNITGRKKNTKTVQMIIIFALFIVCWIPFIICSFLLQARLPVSMLENIICAREYLAKLGYVNSSLNWIVYGLANKKFQTAFKKILWCKCCDMVSNLASSSTLSGTRRATDALNQLENVVKLNGYTQSSNIHVQNCQKNNDLTESITECNNEPGYKMNVRNLGMDSARTESCQNCHMSHVRTRYQGLQVLSEFKTSETETNLCRKCIEYQKKSCLNDTDHNIVCTAL